MGWASPCRLELCGRAIRAGPTRRRAPIQMLLAVACLALAAGALAEVQTVADLGARIDWSSGEVRIRAEVPAKPKSSAAALKDDALSRARQNLKALLAKLSKGGSGTYAIPGADHPDDLAKLVASAKTVSAGSAAKDGYQVTLSVVLPRAKAKADAAAPPETRAYKDPDPSQVRAYPPLPPTGEEALLTGPDVPGPFTGLIVDGRGLDLQTAMSPRVLDAALRDVYTGAHASVEFVEDVGVVGYMGTIASALKLPRVGSRPLVVRAIGTGDEQRTTAVVSLADARQFLSDTGAAGVMTRCAVCFVVDSLSARDRQ